MATPMATNLGGLMATRVEDVAAYIQERVRIDADGCWNWLLAKNNNGYGLCFRRDWRGLAHRFSYVHMVEAIGPEMQVDHLCMNKACINPAHLEVVSAKENAQRERRNRFGRNYSVYQQANGLWCASISHTAKNSRLRKSFRSKSREAAVAKAEKWLDAS